MSEQKRSAGAGANYVCENCGGKGGLYEADPNPLRDCRAELSRLRAEVERLSAASPATVGVAQLKAGRSTNNETLREIHRILNDCGAVPCADQSPAVRLRDVLQRLRAERVRLAEACVRAGMESQAAQALSVGSEREAHAVAAIAARVLAEFDAQTEGP